ncbi:hypothetical protein VTJ83DRAFT_3947 [Remersonia thermophila]|uniref:Mediator of RNA polymerase II transcription subunit 11 n=1 Tax=Remersonia thermophila TaxID=72144 RepID=A0ABR4DFH4_9PEZI
MDAPMLPPDQNTPSPTTGRIDIHEPFTRGQRIQQLSAVDKDIASLLIHLSSALRALATPPSTSVQPAARSIYPDDSNDVEIPDAEVLPPLEAFQTAQSAFFTTVDRIDKQLTRQILALEEAGIVTLRNATEQQPQATGAEALPLQQPQQQQTKGAAAPTLPVTLEPDGMGRYGQLEVGQLNLASSTVEKDFEAELWKRAMGNMVKILEAQGIQVQHRGDAMEE